MDLGASQTVIGEHQVNDVIQQLPKSTPVREVPRSTVFRFGNSSTVKCDRALLIPLGPYYVKICIVPSKTPFLLSNNMFRKLEASIHTASDEIFFGRLNLRLPLQLTEKKLYLLDFAELVRLAQKASDSQVRGSPQVSPDSILNVNEGPGSRSLNEDVQDHQPSRTTTGQSESCPSHPEPSSEPDRHVRHVQQQGNVPGRSLQGSADSCDGRTAGSRSDVPRGTVHDENHLRRGQERSDLSREVLQTDPKYVSWFLSRYQDSPKPAHKSFVSYLRRRIEDEQINRGVNVDSPQVTSTKGYPMAKASATLRPASAEENAVWVNEGMWTWWRRTTRTISATWQSNNRTTASISWRTHCSRSSRR